MSGLVLDGRELQRYAYDPDAKAQFREDPGEGEAIPLDEGEKWANTRLDGGEPMATNVRDNLQSMAFIMAAIESSETGEVVDVQELLAEAEASVEL